MAYLKGSSLTLPSNAISIDAIDVDNQFTIHILVKRSSRNGKTLQDHAEGLASYSTQVLSYDDFHQQFSADESDIQSIVDFANANNLTVTKNHATGATVTLKGSAGAFNSAFKITLLNITDSNGTYRSYVGKLTVPENLINIIDSIIGLHNPVSFKRETIRLTDNASLRALTPLQVAAAYNFPNNGGVGQCIALIEIPSYDSNGIQNGGGFTVPNLSSSFATLAIVPPTVEFVSIDGITNIPGLSTDKSNTPETMLDIFVAGAVAPGAKFIVYEGPSDLAGVYDSIYAAVHDTTNNPSIISISLGVGEQLLSGTILSAFDQLFQQAAILGITICVSSGDTGSIQSDYSINVSWPASSPWVLSVGGTSLELNDNNTIFSEVAWNNILGASGGGVSSAYPAPSWQTGLIVTDYPAATTSTISGRGVPDVSANGDPYSGYSFYYGTDNRYTIGVGGTSAAAPLWAGLIARFNALTGYRAGFINPTLYANPGIFQDITVGNNSISNSGISGYGTSVGWDAVTGLGSPNSVAIYNYLLPPVPITLSVTLPYGPVNYAIPILANHGVTSLIITGNPSHGSITVSGTIIFYTSFSGYSGLDSLQYKAVNAYGISNSVTLTITIQPPTVIVASDVYQTVGYNSFNDVINLNLNTTPTIVRVLSNPYHGTAVVYGLNILYSPNSNYSGPDTFTYNAGNDGGTSAVAHVYINVLPPVPVSIDTSQDIPFNSSNVLVNTLVGNYPTQLYVVTTATHGALYTTGTYIYYSPIPGYAGPDSFKFNASNDAGLSNTATVSLNVLFPDIPITNTISQTVIYDSNVNIINPLVTSFFNTVTIVNKPSYGTAIVNGLYFLYYPNTGFDGTDTFTYNAINISGVSNTSPVLITVTPPTLQSFPIYGSLPGGQKNALYVPTRFTATGGKDPYNASLVSGVLPSGLTLNTGTSILSGITTASGIYNFIVQVTDSSTPIPVTTVSNYSIVVYDTRVSGSFQWITSEGLIVTTSSGGTVNVSLKTNDSSATFSLLAGNLPNGISLSSTGTIYGTVPDDLFENKDPFIIRASSSQYNKIADNTFYIDVLPVSAPIWNYSSNPTVLFGPSIGHTFIDREYINIPITASSPSVKSTPYNISYRVVSPVGSLPNGLTLQSNGVLSGKLNVLAFKDSVNTYTFTIAASDGNIESSQTFIMNVINVDSLRTDSTLIGFDYGTSTLYVGTLTNSIGIFTSTIFDSVSDLSTVQAPIFLNESNLGSFIPNDNMYAPVTAYDPFPYLGPVTYSTPNSLPLGLKLDVNSGILFGSIPTQINYLQNYSIEIIATKTSNFDNVSISSLNTFTFSIIDTNRGSISWITTSNLGTITIGIPSNLYVISTSTNNQRTLQYNIVSGSLPNGLYIDTYGNILGTTFQPGVFTATFISSVSTAYNLSTWATIDSSKIYPDLFSIQTFNLEVTIDPIGYTNIYVKPFLSQSFRRLFNQFLSNTSIFLPNYIYRSTDVNFGVQTTLRMYLEYGIQLLNSNSNYISALQQNFYKKTLYFGQVKYLTALNNGTEVYDVVYIEIVDPLDGAKQSVNINGSTYYPNSIANMKSNLSNLNNGDIKFNPNFLPLWQQTSINSGVGFINGIVLCYTIPKKGKSIVDIINNQQAFNFKGINFTVDRIIFGLSSDNSYLLFPNTDIK